MKSISDKIKRITAERDVSLQSIAERIGVTKDGLYKMVRDDSYKVETLQKIADVLFVPIGIFFLDDLEFSRYLDTEENQGKVKTENLKGYDFSSLAKDFATELKSLSLYEAMPAHFSSELITIIDRIEEDETYTKSEIRKDLKRINKKILGTNREVFKSIYGV